jgi:lipopolysaccharide export system permease protein
LSVLIRYLLKELALPLAIGIGFLFLLLFVMQFLRGADVLLGSAVTGRDMLRILFYLSPHLLVMALPVGFLMAILLGLGRMAEDRELTALQSLGVGPWHVVAVPLAVGAVLGGVMLLFSFSAEPWGLTAVKRVVNDIIKKNVVGDVKPGVFYEDLSHLTVYAQDVIPQERRWVNVLLHDDSDPRSPLLVLAPEAKVNPSAPGEALKIGLIDGAIHRANRSSSDYTRAHFERGEIVVGVDDSLFRKNRFRSPRDELTPKELLQEAASAKAEGGDPRPFLMAFYGRFGQALTPVSFALLGTALAMSRRQSRARGYLLTIVGYVAYYVLYKMFENMGMQGRLPAPIAGQLHNVLFAGLGLLALRRVSQAGTVR